MPYVTSTLSAAVAYTLYKQSGNDLPRVLGSVTIAGGHGVANANLITPNGVLTKVTDDELRLLEQVPLFQTHKERGFIQVLPSKVDSEVAAADMAQRDGSAPLNDADFEKPPVAKKRK